MIENQAGALLQPGITCWRLANASRCALIVDAADYFMHLREALTNAEQVAYLIGWDFDLRIEMVPGQSDENGNAPDGWPNGLGHFLEAVVDRRPELHLHILKWGGAMLAQLATQAWETLRLKMASKRIRLALDRNHPVGACHHQKIVVIDDCVAFCGGIDVTTGRWDTRDHTPDDARRADPDGTLHQPWHDVTTALEGDAAEALGILARNRWLSATGEQLPAPTGIACSSWPKSLKHDFLDIEVGIARTEPCYDGKPLINEIEELYLAAVRAARHTIYIENQYLTAGTLCEAMEARLAEPDAPEIVIINPKSAQGFLEDEAMHSIRSEMIQRLREADKRGRGGHFSIFHPSNANGTPIYVHAKVFVVDGRFLKIGSSNIDNRSMAFDTECDIAIEAGSSTEHSVIQTFTLSLLAEHLGCDPKEFEAAWQKHGSLSNAINVLRTSDGRSLHPIEPHQLDPLERVLAGTRILDPRFWPRSTVSLKERVHHVVKHTAATYQSNAAGIGKIIILGSFAATCIWAGRWLVKRSQRQTAAQARTEPNSSPPSGSPRG